MKLVAHLDPTRSSDFDARTGALTPRAPDDGSPRGWWQEYGPIRVVFYREGTRLHLRIGPEDYELGSGNELSLAPDGDDNTLRISRDGALLLSFRYGSARPRLVGSFVDPYEEERDFDLILFAHDVSIDPEWRKRIFATEEELALGELTEADLRTIARTALASVFPRRHVVEVCDEIERWFMRVGRDERACWFCRSQSTALLGYENGAFTATFGDVKRICVRCLARASRWISHTAPLRAERAFADLERALNGRGAVRDAEVRSRLAAAMSAANPSPVAAQGACFFCARSDGPRVQLRGSTICGACAESARAVWRQGLLDLPPNVPPDRFEALPGTPRSGTILCFEAAPVHRRLEVWVDFEEGRAPELFAWQFERWLYPFEDMAVDEPNARALKESVRLVLLRAFADTPAIFRDE